MNAKKNNNSEVEHTIEKPIEIKGERGQEFAVQCSECEVNVIFPKEPPLCPSSCLERMDLCKHGVACAKCSRKLMLEWIREGNMKARDFPQLEAVKKMIWDEYKLEIFVNKRGYLEIKE